MERPSGSPPVRRRAVLGSLAVGASGATGGCLRRLRTAAGWQSTSPVSLGIKTLPADADPYALRIARSVAGWYRAAGLDATVTPMDPEELYRQVLLDADFDAFVARAPRWHQDPDALYALLHSRFAEEPGWQNPFGYANLDVDEHLATQRRADPGTRREALVAVQQEIARTQPFSVVVFPDDIRAARSDRYAGWAGIDFTSPRGYLALDRVRNAGQATTATTATTATAADGDTLRVVGTDRRPTENLNPLGVEFRRNGVVTGLLYDSLGYETEVGTVEPWLAATWEFVADGPNPRARVRLRSDLTWHDGTPITADDVAFTYALLADVTLGRSDARTATTTENAAPVSAPRFRGRSSLVTDVVAVDDRTAEFRFADCSARVATRAFTVPLFPRHVWAERTDPAAVGGFALNSTSEALVTNNVPPVGSGPFAYVGNVPRERLELERFDDHFLAGDAPEDLPDRVAGGPPCDRLVIRVVGSDETAVSVVANGEADVTGSAVSAATVPRIGRSDDLDLFVRRSSAPYVVGYNTRRPPLTNPRFRRTLARLVDQDSLVADVFDGYARPAASPLAGTSWVPDDLTWDGGNPATPFLGADGTVDVEAARAAFRDVGYEYDDGTLVERN